MDFDVCTLIEHVKVRPALWDHQHDCYHNRRAIEKCWKEISQLMKVPPEILKKKWKYLRDQFRMECRKIPEDKYHDTLLTLADYREYVTWTFFKPLYFLKSQIKSAKKIRRYSVDENEETEDETKDIPAENTTEEQMDFGKMFVLENIASISQDNYEEQILQVQKEPQTQKLMAENHKTNNDDDDDERHKRLEKKLDAAISQQIKRKNFDDDIEEDRAFFASILPHVKKLTPAEKMLCRIDIQNIVYKHAYKTD